MNYHYIEYMIKERRKEEAEECDRLLLLNRVGYSRAGCMKRILVSITKKFFRGKDQVRLLDRSILGYISYRIFQTDQKGRRA